MARCIVQEKDNVSFLSFQTVVQHGKDSNHYLTHAFPLLKYGAPKGYDEFGIGSTAIRYFLSQ